MSIMSTSLPCMLTSPGLKFPSFYDISPSQTTHFQCQKQTRRCSKIYILFLTLMMIRYLQLYIHNFNLIHILALNKTVPKLMYLEISVPFSSIPNVVWTFDRDSLPLKTGFVALNLHGKQGYMIDVRHKNPISENTTH